MTLDSDNRARLDAWIKAKVVRRHCPACEHAIDWDVVDLLELELAPCNSDEKVSVPVVPLVCPN